MSFSTFSDVRSICDTDLSDSEIVNVISWCDSMIKLKINTASPPSGFGLSGAEWSAFLEGLSATWSCYRVMLKDPEAMGLGELNYERPVVLELLKKEIDDMLKMGDGGVSTSFRYEPRPTVL